MKVSDENFDVCVDEKRFLQICVLRNDKMNSKHRHTHTQCRLMRTHREALDEGFLKSINFVVV